MCNKLSATILNFVILILVAIPAFADLEQDFNLGVEKYRSGEYAEAAKIWEETLSKDTDNPLLLSNLGLSYFQLDQKGRAIAFLRRAQYVDPENVTAASSIDFISKQLPVPAKSLSLWSTLRKKVLIYLSLPMSLAVSSILFFAASLLWIRYWGARRRAETNETPYPSFPWMGLIFTLGFLCFTSLTLAKYIDDLTERATVLTVDSARSAPEASQAALFELPEGAEVIVRQTTGDWAQITDVSGQTGWMPKTKLYLHSGGDSW